MSYLALSAMSNSSDLCVWGWGDIRAARRMAFFFFFFFGRRTLSLSSPQACKAKGSVRVAEPDDTSRGGDVQEKQRRAKKKKESNQHKDSTPMTAYPVHQLGQRSFPVLKLDLVLFKELCNLVVVVDCHSNQAMHRLFEGG